ncbi:hypothetical protein D0T51_08490 [Parabacteroides sp. 52]|uniref:type IX secretion system anionic LPS delivery protein PorZ n=1 Tax=unclassified Parabacteroides TaxID=2649774 RepID=UPI0013D35513|nr:MULTISPECIES: two-component regulator propeller domain-containing protein [unclassified Parabacteroides]MDH6534753.1 hypothetical protein [Parabacteroides sp. PM5-20]NDV55759.1 hypothetical protein [Parabacteroides sp. 52]
MKKIIYLFTFLIYFCLQSIAQNIGSWQTYMSYYDTRAVTEGNNNIFAIAGNSLFSFGKDDASIRTYSKPELSDTKIDTIAFNTDLNTLLIVYSNGNIDLLNEKGIHNIPFLMKDISIPDKEINGIFFHKEKAYLSAQFGIMVINMEKKEITDTYRLKKAVHSSCIYNNHLYAATPEGIIYGHLNDNLLDTNNWKSLDNIDFPKINAGFEGINIQQIYVFNEVICMHLQKRGIYYLEADEINKQEKTAKVLLSHNSLQHLTLQNNKLIAYSEYSSNFNDNQAYIYSSLNESFTLTTGPLYGITSLKNNSIFWIAAGPEGIKGIKKSGNELEVILSGTQIEGPKRDLSAYITFHKEKLLVCGGGRWVNRSRLPWTFMTYENKKWNNFDDDKIITDSPIEQSLDVTSAAVDPQNENHYFVSTWGEGVFEIENNKFVNLYGLNNSTLESSSDDKKDPHYIRVEGLCYDKNNNLWMTNSGVNNAIKVLKSDGTWASLMYADLKNQNLIDKILIRKNNHKWVNVIRGQNSTSGIFIFDDKGTIDDQSDDVSRFYTSFTSVSGEGNITPNVFYCMAEDHDGYIWLGTNLGPVRIASPQNALADRSMGASRIVHTQEDGTPTYLLDGESVRCIAVDGGNRKWFGTESSGVLIVSPDALEIVEQFKTENSPLPSNRIESIAINPVTGEAFIGTDKGMVSYMGGATEGTEDYSDVYAFPNPVRPEYQDMVTITGLVANSNVKITDVSGNLVVQGTSLGGQFTWDCRRKNGQRVATGIYLVLSATNDEDKSESVVTKIMVIK